MAWIKGAPPHGPDVLPTATDVNKMTTGSITPRAEGKPGR
jgi:hypothetical protein